jgi:formamidopyrimidine-DNA glycosylase
MPELPEVHTTVEGLKTVVIGKTIIDAWSDFHVGSSHGNRSTIKNKKYFEQFKKTVVGSKIKNIERRGKNILIHLSPRTDSEPAYTIVVHMKMTGCLMYKKNKDEKYLHFVLTFKSEDFLLLSDLRKFASVTITETKNLNTHESLAKLGPDPLDKTMNAKKLFEIIRSKNNLPIKSALLDQTAIAGIGNIYSDEILWTTSIHPLSKSNKVPRKKFVEIIRAMKKILKFSIKYGGDSKSDYRNAFGEKGGFQNFHQVYGKKKENCQKKGCSGIIDRIVVKGRSAHFCPRHQINYQ